MVQPVPTVEPYERADELVAALGVDSSRLPVEAYDNGARHAFVVLGSREQVAALRPDMTAIAGHDLVGAIACAGEGASWKLRMFSPIDGMGEDAATGSAAGPLACHLARHGEPGQVVRAGAAGLAALARESCVDVGPVARRRCGACTRSLGRRHLRCGIIRRGLPILSHSLFIYDWGSRRLKHGGFLTEGQSRF